MGYISGILCLVAFGLIAAKKYRAAIVTLCFAGLAAWGEFMRSS